MLSIETKVDSAEKLAAIAGKPTENYLFADEVNQIVNGINTLEENVESLANSKQENLTDVNFGAFTNSVGTEDDIQDSDKFGYIDSSDSNKFKKISWLTIKAKLTTVFNALFVPKTRTITIGGVTQDLSADRTFSGGGNDIVITKFFPSYPLAAGGFILNNWYSFQYPNNFIEANLNSGTNYGTGSSPVGTPSIVVPSFFYIPNKKIDKFAWHMDYCDQTVFKVSIVKYDLVSGVLVNAREILNQNITITSGGPNTQNAIPYSKNKVEFTTIDSVDTPIGAQCSVYFLFYQHLGGAGGGAGPSKCYFHLN